MKRNLASAVALVIGVLVCLAFAGINVSMGANSLESLAGDKDSFGTDKPEGSAVSVNEIIVSPQDPGDGQFDLWEPRFFTWEHVFTLPPGASVTGATLTIVTLDVEDDGEGDDLGGEPYDDRLFIDGVEVPGAFDSTFTAAATADTQITPNTDIFILGPAFFPLLQDGSITVLVDAHGGELKDVIAIDYALLELEFDLEFGLEDIIVFIDIKPGSYPNSINLKSRGVIPVAILGSATFDVTDVDVATLLFGPDGALPAHDLGDPDVLAGHLEDVNGDGLLDLVSHYRTRETGIVSGDIEACLTGTSGGVFFKVWDDIVTVPSK